MNPLEILAEHAKRHEKPFVVIGGHALAAYGINRLTADLDLMVPMSDKDWWMEKVSALKLDCYQNNDAFARFTTVDKGIWPVDLMFLQSEDFEKFKNSAKQTQILQTEVLVPKNTHIIALKLFAIKSNPEKRYLKDFGDIVDLIKKASPPIKQEDLKLFCEKYGPPSIYEEIKKYIS